MKKLAFLVAALAVLTSCDKKNDTPAFPDYSAIAGTYTGYSDAVNGMGIFAHYPTDGESFTIADNGDGTVNLLFTSKVWGTYNIENTEVTEVSGVYTIAGAGTATITMPGSPNSADAEYSLTATIKSRTDATIVVTMPGLMPGGTVMTFYTGAMPEELK
jgi:hypothetical protein